MIASSVMFPILKEFIKYYFKCNLDKSSEKLVNDLRDLRHSLRYMTPSSVICLQLKIISIIGDFQFTNPEIFSEKLFNASRYLRFSPKYMIASSLIWLELKIKNKSRLL